MTTMRKVTLSPNEGVGWLEVTVVAVLLTFTVCTSDEDQLPSKTSSPKNSAIRKCSPTPSALVVSVATPLTTCLCARKVSPSKKRTQPPDGGPLTGVFSADTVAVNVTS